eukprot:6012107-Pyramimonas_sp.AAC.1
MPLVQSNRLTCGNVARTAKCTTTAAEAYCARGRIYGHLHVLLSVPPSCLNENIHSDKLGGVLSHEGDTTQHLVAIGIRPYVQIKCNAHLSDRKVCKESARLPLLVYSSFLFN